MASKGQKFKKYTLEQKEMILKEYFEKSVGERSLGRKYGIPHETIKNWVTKIKHPERFSNLKRGRKKSKNLTLEDYKERYEILKKYQAFLQARRGKK